MWGIMNLKPHKTVFIKLIWAIGRPGSIMEMRQASKAMSKDKGTMACTFPISHDWQQAKT